MELPKLYLISDRLGCQNLYSTVEESFKGGLRMFQLREKDLSSRELLELARDFRELSHRFNALLIINDRLDIALAVGADGIHVGINSMPVPIIKNTLSRLNQDMMIGYSAHSLDEALKVMTYGVDWITYSPIFDTPSKKSFGPPQGVDSLIEVINRVDIPVFALGGIKVHNIEKLKHTGVHGLAVISEIISTDDPMAMTQRILDELSHIS